MAGQSGYELVIRAYVKDEVTKQLGSINQAVQKTEDATKSAGAATGVAAGRTALMERQLASLAARFTPVILGTMAFHRALNLLGQAQRFVADEAERMISAATDAQEAQGALAAVFGEFAS